MRFPDRYMDERGRAMWDRVMGLLERKSGKTEKSEKPPRRKLTALLAHRHEVRWARSAEGMKVGRVRGSRGAGEACVKTLRSRNGG